LVAAPRRWMRLLGVAGRTWPRSESEDPLLPDHVLSRRRLVPVPITQRDRRCFELLVIQPAEEIVVSRSRRSADGALQSASALWPVTAPVRTCARTRIPEHAFSEADRLLARPAEAGRSGRIKAALTCWRNWDRDEATPHDGAVRAGHPAVARAVSRLHSATSLRLMARDPLGFLWRYALDMQPVALAELPLALDPLAFGELVHELLARTIDSLEPAPGFVRASRDEIELALAGAVDHVALHWPLERAVPPSLLWKHSLAEAARRGLRGLTIDESFEADTTSWSEVEFGLVSVPEGARSPWPIDGEILIGTEKLKLSGRIDRVDFAAGGDFRLQDRRDAAAS
jgi:PD-(D/E)XK nuclease superfamily